MNLLKRQALTLEHNYEESVICNNLDSDVQGLGRGSPVPTRTVPSTVLPPEKAAVSLQ